MTDEEKRVLADIKSSGLPLEIETSSILNNNEWDIRNQVNYLDQETNKERPIDIIANKWIYTLSNSDLITFELVIECKRDKKPWVFFTGQEERYRNLKTVFYYKYANNNVIDSDFFLTKFESHYKQKKLPQSVIHYEPFKQKKITKEKIQTAKNQVVKALNHELIQIANIINYGSSKNRLNKLYIFYPVIVFEGLLYELKYSNKELLLEKINHILYKFNYAGDSYLIDVVTKNYFSEFLKLIDAELECLKKSPIKLFDQRK